MAPPDGRRAAYPTIIGIPLGIANLKLVALAILPLGREIVSVVDAERRGPGAA